MYCIQYTRGNGMGKHANYFGIKLVKNGKYCVCISIREPQEISFSASLVKKSQSDCEGIVCPGLGFKMTTHRGVDACIMTFHGKEGCFLCFTDSKINVAVQAQHEVKKLDKGVQYPVERYVGIHVIGRLTMVLAGSLSHLKMAGLAKS